MQAINDKCIRLKNTLKNLQKIFFSAGAFYFYNFLFKFASHLGKVNSYYFIKNIIIIY